jgi:hypothetical protein
MTLMRWLLLSIVACGSVSPTSRTKGASNKEGSKQGYRDCWKEEPSASREMTLELPGQLRWPTGQESLTIRVRLKNRAGRPLMVNKRLLRGSTHDLSYELLISMRDRSGRDVSYETNTQTDFPTARDYHVLQPEQSVETVEVLRRSEFKMSAGRHHLQACFVDNFFEPPPPPEGVRLFRGPVVSEGVAVIVE